jgi:SAM-dependent methyltransferase
LAILDGIAARGQKPYGYDAGGLDERVVEYAWVFERVEAHRDARHVLDAGSVLNHKRILDAWRQAKFPPVSIVTLAHEGYAEASQAVRYAFADLRRLPWRDQSFDIVLSLSTLEHVGLDNRSYGASGAAGSKAPDAGPEVVAAMRELQRITRPGGTLLLSVPFGARSNRGWFRIFDRADLEIMTSVPGWRANAPRIFRAERDGWRETSMDAAATAGYNEPPGRERTAPTWVASAEAVALVELTRSAGT